jgi:deazaflavin-dependent oxidoreductase (nitroreductase family)
MAKQFRFTFIFKAGNALMRTLLALGISVNGTTLITVPGRKSGQPHSTPITMVEFDGQRYVQSPFGNVDWVRNLRAAGKATLSWGRRHETVIVTELSPEQAAPVIKSMMTKAPKMIQDYFDVTPKSSLQEFILDAPKHPVFAVHPAEACDQKRGTDLARRRGGRCLGLYS